MTLLVVLLVDSGPQDREKSCHLKRIELIHPGEILRQESLMKLPAGRLQG